VTFAGTDTPTLSVDSGTFEPASFGVNTCTATGPTSSGGTNVASFLIDIEAASASAAGSGASSGSGLAFTGADLAALIAAALALILMGTGVVAYTRRRANSTTKV
jgi:hypothetical protein